MGHPFQGILASEALPTRLEGPQGPLRMTEALGTLRRSVRPDPQGILFIEVSFTPAKDMDILALEDRYEFVPARRPDGDPLRGPLDFIWSPGIKARPEHCWPHWAFKSPAVMLQQGASFAALVPDLDSLTKEGLTDAPVALDLDVTSGKRPWMSYGIVSTEPEGHSYFARSKKPIRLKAGVPLSFSYRLMVSREPLGEGYRKVAHLLWERYGRPAFERTLDLQRNLERPELWAFDAWRQEAWGRYADEVWRPFELDGRPVGTLVSLRKDAHKTLCDDAWFNAWFQTLRTAYGMQLHAERTGDAGCAKRALAVLDLALSAPRKGGAFPTVARREEKGLAWYRDAKWSGHEDRYHAINMSWTAYWVLKLASRLPERREACLALAREHADFLVVHQLPSGCIPAWYDADLKPAEEFQDFNAETPVPALFLLECHAATGERAYLEAARRALDFTTREVLPRQRWFDFETFLSCARKPFDFYDGITAQYPQNNLAMIQAAEAYLRLFQLTGDPGARETGERVLDYLLLTQQVWNHPLLTPRLVGGFTTQNTDAEWSDARQGYVATVLLDWYGATGRRDDLERAVAAARSTFAVAPYENWAHKGWEDKHGAMTGFHWGTGSAMATVEMMQFRLGDAFINLARGHAVGFNACTLRNLVVSDAEVRVDLEAAPCWKGPLQVRVEGAAPGREYRLVVNGKPQGSFSGNALLPVVP